MVVVGTSFPVQVTPEMKLEDPFSLGVQVPNNHILTQNR